MEMGRFMIFAVVILAIFGAVVYSSAQEKARWEAFSKSHACKIIAKSEGRWGYGIGSDGKSTSVYIDGTTTYRCNDGIDYTR